MKPTTEVFARFSSTGKPRFNKDINGPIAEIIRALIPWMLEAHMGTSIRITLARTPEELRLASGEKLDSQSSPEDFMAILEQEMAQHQLGLDHHDDA